MKVSEVKQLRKFEDLNIDRFLHTRAYVIISVHIVLFLMLEEEYDLENQKVLLNKQRN